MKRFATSILLAAALAGCVPSESSIDALFGIKRNVAVLSYMEFDLSEPISFEPKETAEVVGNDIQICVVLRREKIGQGLNSGETNKLLDESKVDAIATFADGSTHEFTCPSISWVREGRLSASSSEVASCVRPGCGKEKIVIGSKLQSVSVSSKSPVHILGAYWESTAALDGRK